MICSQCLEPKLRHELRQCPICDELLCQQCEPEHYDKEHETESDGMFDE